MVKVTLLGAGGGIGQSLSLLLRQNKDIRELALFDLRGSIGVATDISHIPTTQSIKGYEPIDKTDQTQIQLALRDSDIVIITAGIPRKPSMTRNDLFKVNASIMRSLVQQVGRICPNAFLCIVSNPVNSLVPLAAEQLKLMNVYNSKKLLGISTLDNLRLEQFLSDLLSIEPKIFRTSVTCIGGHSGNTIVPIIGSWRSNISAKEEYEELIKRVQYGGDEVVKAKNGSGSATLSTALATNRFINSLVTAIAHGKEVNEVAYVNVQELGCKNLPEASMVADYFCLPITVTHKGIKHATYPRILIEEETVLIQTAVECIKKDIQTGVDIIQRSKL